MLVNLCIPPLLLFLPPGIQKGIGDMIDLKKTKICIITNTKGLMAEPLSQYDLPSLGLGTISA